MAQSIILEDSYKEHSSEVVAIARGFHAVTVGQPFASKSDSRHDTGNAKVFDLSASGGIHSGCYDSELEFKWKNKKGQVMWKDCKFIAKDDKKRCVDKTIRKPSSRCL